MNLKDTSPSTTVFVTKLIAQQKASVYSVKLLNEDEDKACAYEHIKGFETNVNYCIEHQLNLISFCH